jgi:protein phosphatase
VVCDGIGSQDDSQIASFITVDVFRENFERHSKIFNIDRFFNKCLKSSYNKITSVANKKLNGRKIGTTLVVTFVDNNKVVTYNLGDSRLYHFSLVSNSWIQITRDHNLYNHFIDLAEKDKTINVNELCMQYRNQLLALTKCLESGTNAHIDYDKFVFKIELGDILFQATDGVYHYLKLADVNNIMKNNTNNFSTIAKSLIQMAIQNKSNDNLTCVVMETVNGDVK